MQNKLLSILFSTRLMALLFIVFAVAMGVGTFVESYYSTETARQYIYNAHWFEVIMVLFAINFFGNIFRYNLHKREKWSTLLLHMSFVLIIVGAGITRYIGFEGIMPIREGQATNKFMSEKTFLTFMIDGEVDGEALRRRKSEELLLAPKGNNDITINTDFKGDPISFKVVNYIHGAEEGFRETEDGVLGAYNSIGFGDPMTFETFMKHFKTGDIYFDCGMHQSKKKNIRNYCQWRMKAKFSDSLIVSRHH